MTVILSPLLMRRLPGLNNRFSLLRRSVYPVGVCFCDSANEYTWSAKLTEASFATILILRQLFAKKDPVLLIKLSAEEALKRWHAFYFPLSIYTASRREEN